MTPKTSILWYEYILIMIEAGNDETFYINANIVWSRHCKEQFFRSTNTTISHTRIFIVINSVINVPSNVGCTWLSYDSWHYVVNQSLTHHDNINIMIASSKESFCVNVVTSTYQNSDADNVNDSPAPTLKNHDKLMHQSYCCEAHLHSLN